MREFIRAFICEIHLAVWRGSSTQSDRNRMSNSKYRQAICKPPTQVFSF